MITKLKNLLRLQTVLKPSISNYIQSLFSVYFCISFVVIVLGINLNSTLNVKENISPIDLSLGSVIWQFIISVLFIPIFEELAFRLPLAKSFVKQVVGIDFLIFSFLIIFNIQIGFEFIFLIFCCTLYLYEQFLKNEPPMFEINWKSIMVFAILFGLIHIIKNFQIFGIYDWRLLLILPISVIPQFLFGIIASLIRVNTNLLNSIYLHIFNNILVFMPTFVYILPITDINLKNTLTLGFPVLVFVFSLIFMFTKNFCKYQSVTTPFAD